MNEDEEKPARADRGGGILVAVAFFPDDPDEIERGESDEKIDRDQDGLGNQLDGEQNRAREQACGKNVKNDAEPAHEAGNVHAAELQGAQAGNAGEKAPERQLELQDEGGGERDEPERRAGYE